jgi:uncharacterized protein (TIGR03032 family)
LATPLSLPIPASSGLIAWLHALGIALAFTTYRANRLIFLGTAEPAGEPAEPASGSAEPNQPTGAPQLKLHERLFDRPMGLFVAGESLWMAARCQIWRLDNLLGPGQLHEGGDRLYVPAISFTTGDVNAHELVLGADGQPIFVNTAFSCLATLAPGCSFAPTWAPPFITKLAGDDRCHLNGLALKDGIPTWASACGGSGEPSAWRNNRSGGGVLIHIPSGELAATGLSMPHSPRWHDGKLWLLNSGTGELGWIEEGRFHSLCALPGFVRGLAFASGCAVVGLSKLRYPVLAEPFAALDADRFGFLMAGTLPQYLDWLEGLDIGLAPLLPTEFNRCRSDVKFLEYASRSLVPVLQNLDPYRHLAGSGAALLFGDPDDLIRQLDRLVAEPELRQSIASTAHALVGRERQLAQHAPERLAVYRELAESTTRLRARPVRCSSRRRSARSPPCRACSSWLPLTGAWASPAQPISSACWEWMLSSAAPWRWPPRPWRRRRGSTPATPTPIASWAMPCSAKAARSTPWRPSSRPRASIRCSRGRCGPWRASMPAPPATTPSGRRRSTPSTICPRSPREWNGHDTTGGPAGFGNTAGGSALLERHAAGSLAAATATPAAGGVHPLRQPPATGGCLQRRDRLRPARLGAGVLPRRPGWGTPTTADPACWPCGRRSCSSTTWAIPAPWAPTGSMG